MNICVIGLGYIGLPTAIMFALHGVHVHGVDINTQIITSLKEGKLHIKEPELDEKFHQVVKSGKFTFSSEPKKADIFILAVPTPITKDKKADLSFVENATSSIVPFLEKDNLVVVESTVPPGTIEKKIVPILSNSGLKIGDELLVSHSPERVLPGNLFQELVVNDRIVGGINEKSSNKTVDLYKRFVTGTIYTTNVRTAEMVKLIENTYRDVNIALANELAMISEKLNINIWDAIKLANNHPRVNIHSPGPGVGGHCIAVDPWFIIEQSPEQSKLISTARKINESAPKRVVKLIEHVIQNYDNPTITIFGLAYKGNIDDIRESPSLSIYSMLKSKGYQLKLYDPYVNKDYNEKVNSIDDAIQGTDCLVILTDHNEFKTISFNNLLKKFNHPNIIDTRNVLEHETLRKGGYTVYQLGTPQNQKNK